MVNRRLAYGGQKSLQSVRLQGYAMQRRTEIGAQNVFD